MTARLMDTAILCSQRGAWGTFAPFRHTVQRTGLPCGSRILGGRKCLCPFYFLRKSEKATIYTLQLQWAQIVEVAPFALEDRADAAEGPSGE